MQLVKLLKRKKLPLQITAAILSPRLACCRGSLAMLALDIGSSCPWFQRLKSYLQVPEQQMIGLDSQLAEIESEFTCEHHMTLLRAVVASATVIKLACECGLPVKSRRLQFAVGRRGDVATLSAAFECGVLRSSYVCDGAARGGCLAELRWVTRDQGCVVRNDISVRAAASGSVPTLNFLKQGGINFTVETAHSAAEAGHQHVIEYLHGEGCPFDDTVYLHAAASGHVHVLQSVRALECAWNSVELCTLAAARGSVHVLQWAKQQGAVFTAENMVHAAMFGRIAVCEYLLAQQCPCNDDVCTAAVEGCHLSTLQWLMEHGCLYDLNALRVKAAQHGHTTVLEFLQQFDVESLPQALMLALFIAGLSSQLAAAQWLRARGAPWPPTLSLPFGDEQQWPEPMVEWARAEGCTSPLE
jgi:hypothetical protein